MDVVVQTMVPADATGVLNDQQVIEVATLGKRVERALGAPQDIDRVGDRPERDVHRQTRPETC